MKILLINNQGFFESPWLKPAQTSLSVEIFEAPGTFDEYSLDLVAIAPDFVLLNIDAPQCLGFNEIQEMIRLLPGVNVMVLSEKASDEALFEAFRCGAKGYFLKGTDFQYVVDAAGELKEGAFVLSAELTHKVLSSYMRIRSSLFKDLKMHKLTPREQDVFDLLCSGATNDTIAQQLFISKNTVRIHVQSVLKKLELKDRQEAKRLYRLSATRSFQESKNY